MKITSLNSIADFSMMQVENLDAYCINALNKDLAYLLAFDTDKLLAGFRETAGLDTKGATRYEGWESTLIGGHSIGHYLSAIAQAYANPGVSQDDKNTLFSMISALIDGLLECQKHSKGKENFLFGAVIVDPENVEKQFDNVEKNRTNIITEAWVPWYTLHKILAGVIDTYKFTNYANALEVAKRIGDWSYNRATGWDEATAAQVIRVEYGGMNEVLYELYALTGEDKYAVVAHYFDSPELFERVNAGGANALNNHHANTTIPKFIGALHRYITCHGKTVNGETIDATKYFEYAKNFWDMVVEKHTYVTGGNSEWEHFGQDYILDKERTNCNCETCNIYNMLKFSRTLFCLTGDVKYANYYENAFYNTILSSQNPETGMTTYFQPMSTGYFKVFGQRFNKFWCCTGTGMENFTKLNDSIFFHDEDNVIINLYESARLDWNEKNISVIMKANLQASDTVSITVETADGQPTKAGIALRLPAWLCKEPTVMIDSVPTSYVIKNTYAIIPAGLKNGSVITLTLPMTVTACPLPDNNRSIAFKYGPTVLSADLGTENMATGTTGMMVTIPSGKISGYDDLVLPDDITPEELIKHPEKYLIKNSAPASDDINDADPTKLKFTLTVNGLTFAPHFSRYKERYGIYFTVRTQDEVIAIKKAKEQALLDKPEGVVIDTVQPGYGQYENDELHRMYDWGGSVGSTDNGTTRYAKAGGSFTYYMCVSEEDNNYLSLTFLKEDSGMTMRISSGDDVFFEDTVDYDGNDETFELRVKVPKNVVDRAQEVTANGEQHRVVPLTFKGSQGAQSARLFGFVYMMNY
ncbi:MAG: glycoside hydrolase family 127 protein [Lachnospiraceae bacterium]|nr:glycoside hydrolase family 127 protein [Lachnospiraceae bacterium]